LKRGGKSLFRKEAKGVGHSGRRRGCIAYPIPREQNWIPKDQGSSTYCRYVSVYVPKQEEV